MKMLRQKDYIASLKVAYGEDRRWRFDAQATTSQDFYLLFSPRGLYHIVFQVVSDVNIQYYSLLSLYGNDTMLK